MRSPMRAPAWVEGPAAHHVHTRVRPGDPAWPSADAVTTRGGRYVQGGECTTVGVAGLIQSGGFGNFSKCYDLAAAGLLEATIVTTDGTVRIANACTNTDLIWSLNSQSTLARCLGRSRLPQMPPSAP